MGQEAQPAPAGAVGSRLPHRSLRWRGLGKGREENGRTAETLPPLTERRHSRRTACPPPPRA